METPHAADITPQAPTDETIEHRQERLASLIGQRTPDLLNDPQSKQIAVQVCQEWEDQMREVMADPRLALTVSDINPELERTIETKIAAAATQNELANLQTNLWDNRGTEGAFEDRVSRVDQEVHDAGDVVEIEREQLAQAVSTKDTMQGDLETLQEVQASFDELREKQGTKGALEQLLTSGRLKSEAMGDLVRKALETATALENAVPPDKAPIVRNLLNQSGLVLAASTPALMFAGFMEQMDNSTDCSR